MGEQNELISVLIPAYNAERYIEVAVRSVLKQTYNNFELIILDDGSTDHTGQICKKLCKKDSRIFYYYQENSGIVEARKQLLSHVTGEWFTFLDADDLIHPQMLEIFLNIAKSNNQIDIVATREIQNISKRLCIGKHHLHYSLDNVFPVLYPGRKLVSNFLYYPVFHVGVTSKLYSSKLITCSFKSIPKIFVGEDACINAILFQKADHVAVVDERLYFYRFGGESGHYYSELSEDISKLYLWRKEFILLNGYKIDDQKKALLDSLYLFHGLSGGELLNGNEIYSNLKALLYESDTLGIKNSIVEYYKSLKTQGDVMIPKRRESILILCKQLVLKFL